MKKSHRNNSSRKALLVIEANTPYFFNAGQESGNQRVRMWSGKSELVTKISQKEVAEILDAVFEKYGIKMVKETAKVSVIKSTDEAKSKKKSSAKTAQAKSDEFIIDGEKFTLNGVFTTKGATYKAQTAGGAKLTTMVVQVTQSQKDAWEAWRKASS